MKYVILGFSGIGLTLNCREQNILDSANMYVFGPLSDTILSSLQYLCRYQWFLWRFWTVTKQVCWNQPRKYQNVEVNPGGLYIIIIFRLH